MGERWAGPREEEKGSMSMAPAREGDRGQRLQVEAVGHWGSGCSGVGELAQRRRPQKCLDHRTGQGTWVILLSLGCSPQLRRSNHGPFWFHWHCGLHLAPSGSLVCDLEEMEARE